MRANRTYGSEGGEASRVLKNPSFAMIGRLYY